MEELQRPVAVAQRFLAAQQQQQQPGEAIRSKELCEAVARHFGDLFSSAAAAQVPVLTRDTADHVPPSGLVRFRGMVADMFNPEFFLGAYKTAAGGADGGDNTRWLPAALYTDEPPEDVEHATQTLIMERRPLLLTPVPCEQDWATAAWAGKPVEPQTPRATERLKRSRDPLDGPAASASASASAVGDDTATNKDTGAAADASAAAAGAAPPASKAAKTAESGDGGAAAVAAPGQQSRDQNGAASDAGAAAEADEHTQEQPSYAAGDCIVQVYGECDHLKLHDVVEVLGVMSVVPELAALHLNDNHPPAQQQAGGAAGGAGDGAVMMDADDMWQERVAALPPTSQVLRLHALSIRKVPANPLAATPSADAPAAAAAAAAGGDDAAAPTPAWAASAPASREQVLSLLSAPLAGDDLAAEYLLLTCLSSVVGRDADGAVGVLPLNLSHCPAASTTTTASSSSSSSMDAAGGCTQQEQVVPGLTAALRTLMPHVAPLPLSLSALNSRRWYPQQHAVSGRLFRGCLQQPEGALLLLDERGLSAGQLGDNGVKNLQALRQVLAQQQLPCGCQVYSHTLLMNQPAVLLSAAGRSLLRDSCTLLQLPLQPQRHQPGTKPPSLTAATAPAAAAAAAWANADVAGPDAIAAMAAAMPGLTGLRQYLASARGSEVRLDQAAAEACVARFRALQAEDAGLGWQDLNTFITLAKLLCASMGQHQFSMEAWDKAVQLERQRRARVAAMQR